MCAHLRTLAFRFVVLNHSGVMAFIPAGLHGLGNGAADLGGQLRRLRGQDKDHCHNRQRNGQCRIFCVFFHGGSPAALFLSIIAHFAGLYKKAEASFYGDFDLKAIPHNSRLTAQATLRRELCGVSLHFNDFQNEFQTFFLESFQYSSAMMSTHLSIPMTPLSSVR